LHFVSTSGHPKERRRNIRKVDIVQKPEQGAKEKRKAAQNMRLPHSIKRIKMTIKKVLM